MTDRQDGHIAPPMFIQENKFPSTTWRKKYKCKKNKGEHVFVIDFIQPHPWRQEQDGTWVNNALFSSQKYPYSVHWKCAKCSKLEMEWTIPDKKFDKHREQIDYSNVIVKPY